MSPEDVWNELRALSPNHAGMSYERLARHNGLQWPCYDEDHPGERVMHWLNSITYLYCVATGLAFYTPHLFWLAVLLGGGPAPQAAWGAAVPQA